MTTPRNVLYYGDDRPLPERRHLRAGPLTVVYEDGDIRYVKFGTREILRRVYVAVRDPNWDTVLPRLSNVVIESTADTFRISYDVENIAAGIDYFWRGAITGGADGTITFSMDGEARSTFRRNRIGFCILHPIEECAGQPCRVEKVDGSVEEGVLPRFISPHQPYADMRAISHLVAPGLWAEVRFAGDIFEMEDQRNWTDASYKTYCTPLALPFPVEVAKGTRISQSVTLTLQGQVPAASARATPEELTFAVGVAPATPLPGIGLGLAGHGGRLTLREIERLKLLNLAHLRADLWLARPDWEATLARAIGETRALGIALELALMLSDAAESQLKALLAALNAAARSRRPRISRWLIFHQGEKSTTERWIRLARDLLSDWQPDAQFAGGTNHFFAELNRGRPPVQLLDAVTYSINPQVHAFDNASLVENLAAQAGTVESARQFSAGRPIIVSPVTLRMRLNPNATAAEPEPAPGELPARVDVRQMSLFGAGWTVGSLKYLAESGVHSVTYYETTGWLGVMETEAGSPLPARFRSERGGVFPMYHVFADVAEFAGGQVVPSRSSDPLTVDGVVLRQDGHTRVLLANFTDQAQIVNAGPLGERAIVRQLDATNVVEAIRDPEAFRAAPGTGLSTRRGTLAITLPPFAVACVDCRES
jgi:hypothetical protein